MLGAGTRGMGVQVQWSHGHGPVRPGRNGIFNRVSVLLFPLRLFSRHISLVCTAKPARSVNDRVGLCADVPTLSFTLRAGTPSWKILLLLIVLNYFFSNSPTDVGGVEPPESAGGLVVRRRGRLYPDNPAREAVYW